MADRCNWTLVDYETLLCFIMHLKWIFYIHGLGTVFISASTLVLLSA